MKIKNKKLKIFMSRKLSVAAAVVFIIMLLAVFVGPYLTVHDPTALDARNRLQGICSTHWLGTDDVGRDVFTRLIHGGQLSIGLAMFGVSISLVFGIVMGLISGYYGGITDTVLSRFIDFLMSIPTFLIAIVSLAILGSGGVNTGIAVGVAGIPLFMRITRSGVLAVKDLDYVRSSRMMGLSDSRIIMTHILPGIIPLLVVTSTLQLGTALLTASALSFLGIGVNPPTPEWGLMLSAARTHMLAIPLGIIAPGTAIMLFVMCTSLIGDGLRDALDPKSID